MIKTVTKFLNVREGFPSAEAVCKIFLKPGDKVDIIEELKGQILDGNDTWFKDNEGKFLWSGGFDDSLSDAFKKITLFDPQRNKISYHELMDGFTDLFSQADGSGISVGVFDTGLVTQHIDFANTSISRAGDFTTNPATGIDNSSEGHGTHVTGLIAASSVSTTGIRGLAPATSIKVYKVIEDDGTAKGANLKAAIEQILKGDIPDIINMSLDITFDEYTAIKPLLDELTTKCICVAAAGNNSQLLQQSDAVFFPAIHDNIISIGAVNKKFLTNNQAPAFNKRVDYIFPLSQLFSCSNQPGNSYAKLQGSSMACALASGLVALLLSKNSALKKDVKNVKQQLDSLAVAYSNYFFTTFQIIKP
jgi:subtilisin family serine protease